MTFKLQSISLRAVLVASFALCAVIALLVVWAGASSSPEGPPVHVKDALPGTVNTEITDIKNGDYVEGASVTITGCPQEHGQGCPQFRANAAPGGGGKAALLIETNANTPAGTYSGRLSWRFSNQEAPLESEIMIDVIGPQFLDRQGQVQNWIPKRVGAPSSDRIVKDETGEMVVVDELLVMMRVDMPRAPTNGRIECSAPSTQNVQNAQKRDADSLACTMARETGATFVGSVPETRTYQLRFPDITTTEQLAAKRSAFVSLAREKWPEVVAVSRSFLGGGPTSWKDVPTTGTFQDYGGPNRSIFDRMRVRDGWDMSGTGATAGTSADGNPRPGSANPVAVAVIDVDFRILNAAGNDRHRDYLISEPEGSPPRSKVTFVSPTSRKASVYHGVRVAGLIGAEGNNGIGIAGMLWDVDLRLYDFLRSSTDEPGTPVQMQEAMQHAVDNTRFNGTSLGPNQTRVVNISYNFFEHNSTICLPPVVPDCMNPAGNRVLETDCILKQAIDHGISEGKDVLWVFAAGNNGQDARCESPGGLPNAFSDAGAISLSVGAVKLDGASWRFCDQSARCGDSNHFFRSDINETVSAPGDRLTTLDGRIRDNGIAGRATAVNVSGTSVSAAIVSGLAALIYSKCQTYTASQVKNFIVGGAETIGAGPHKVINVGQSMEMAGVGSCPSP